MATLAFDGVDDFARFTPISSALADMPNGAATMAALVRMGDQGDFLGLWNSGHDSWFHVLGRRSDDRAADDDGTSGGVIASVATTLTTSTASADNYRIVVVDWAAGAAATERFHWSSTIGSAESWTHSNSSTNNGGTEAGPGTTGEFQLGFLDSEGFLLGEIALAAVWCGVRFSDANVEALWVNKKTSDWYNHSAGTPTFLVECTSTSLTDIGANPSTFSSVTGATATGANPTGWTFDGVGGASPTISPAAAILSAVAPAPLVYQHPFADVTVR